MTQKKRRRQKKRREKFVLFRFLVEMLTAFFPLRPKVEKLGSFLSSSSSTFLLVIPWRRVLYCYCLFGAFFGSFFCFRTVIFPLGGPVVRLEFSGRGMTRWKENFSPLRKKQPCFPPKKRTTFTTSLFLQSPKKSNLTLKLSFIMILSLTVFPLAGADGRAGVEPPHLLPPRQLQQQDGRLQQQDCQARPTGHLPRLLSSQSECFNTQTLHCKETHAPPPFLECTQCLPFFLLHFALGKRGKKGCCQANMETNEWEKKGKGSLPSLFLHCRFFLPPFRLLDKGTNNYEFLSFSFSPLLKSFGRGEKGTLLPPSFLLSALSSFSASSLEGGKSEERAFPPSFSPPNLTVARDKGSVGKRRLSSFFSLLLSLFLLHSLQFCPHRRRRVSSSSFFFP